MAPRRFARADLAARLMAREKEILAEAKLLPGVSATGLDRDTFDAGAAAHLAGRLLGYSRKSGRNRRLQVQGEASDPCVDCLFQRSRLCLYI